MSTIPARAAVKPRGPIMRRYPIWSVKTITIVAIFVIALTAIPIYLFGQLSLLVETDLTLACIAIGLFVFLAVGLYRGVRVRRKDLPETAINGIGLNQVTDSLPNPDLPAIDCPLDVADGGDDGCLSAIFSFLVAIVALVGVVFVVWILINLGFGLAIILFLGLSWVFYRALRQVFARSRQCRGRILPSLGFATLYTVLYTSWLFALVHLFSWLMEA
jgi:hypothetical protein